MKTDWWNQQAAKQQDLFVGWVGDKSNPTKNYIRDYIEKSGYDDCLDCGCGLADVGRMLKDSGSKVAYRGVDQCEHFVKVNNDAGITVDLGSIESLNYPDRSFDIVYTRNVLEHLGDTQDCFKKALSEMLRVASKEVLVAFFLKPGYKYRSETHIIDGVQIYHSQFVKTNIEDFIKPREFSWVTIEPEVVLHIKL